jgi:hypothetical protein
LVKEHQAKNLDNRVGMNLDILLIVVMSLWIWWKIGCLNHNQQQEVKM